MSDRERELVDDIHEPRRPAPRSRGERDPPLSPRSERANRPLENGPAHVRRPDDVVLVGALLGERPEVRRVEVGAERDVDEGRFVRVEAHPLVADSEHELLASGPSHPFGVAQGAVGHHERELGERVDREVHPDRNPLARVEIFALRDGAPAIDEAEPLRERAGVRAERFGVRTKHREKERVGDPRSVRIADAGLREDRFASGA